MFRRITRFVLISELVFSTAFSAHLPLYAEEDSSEDIQVEVSEEPETVSAENEAAEEPDESSETELTPEAEITDPSEEPVTETEQPEEIEETASEPAAEKPAEPMTEEPAKIPEDESMPAEEQTEEPEWTFTDETEIVDEEIPELEGEYPVAEYEFPEVTEDPGSLLNAGPGTSDSESKEPVITTKDKDVTVDAGQQVAVVYMIEHAYANERCVVQIYDPDNKLVTRRTRDFAVNSKATEYKVRWNTGNREAGRYTFRTFMMYEDSTGWQTAHTLVTTTVNLGVKPDPDSKSSEPAANTFIEIEGKEYWYEGDVRQGVYGDPKNVRDKKNNIERGREVCDLNPATKGWYWLDAVYDGAKAENKEVYMPYIFQDEKTMSPEKIEEWRQFANNYTEDPNGVTAEMGDQLVAAIKAGTGKWVRYDENGRMMKGWVTIKDQLAVIYPNQAGNTYYYDYATGLMAKGWTTIGGKTYCFDELTGKLVNGEAPTPGGVPESDSEEDDGPGEYDEAKGQAVVQAAYAQLGSTDLCSVVVNNALSAIGVDCTYHFHGGGWILSTQTIRDAGKMVDSPMPGDVAYYSSNYYGNSSHVAVYVGDGKVISGNYNGSTQLVPVYIGGKQSWPEFYRYY